MVKVAMTSHHFAGDRIDAGSCRDFRSLKDPIRVFVVHVVARVVQFPPVAAGDDLRAPYPRPLPAPLTHAPYPRPLPTPLTHAPYPRPLPTPLTHAPYPRG